MDSGGVLGARVVKIAPPAQPGAADSQASGLPTEWFADIEPRLSGFWLVKRVLPSAGLALIYGHPGSGKSFLALDFAFHVALGWQWNSRPVKQGLVVYVGAEGANGLRNRIVAFKREHNLDGQAVPLVMIPSPINLQDPHADLPRLVIEIREAAALSGAEPALIVIDTVSKTFGAGKENTDDMALYVANCQRIASEFGACVMPIHHRPKDSENETPRGHGSLLGGVDTVLLVETGKPKRARITKQKDGEEGELFAFNLQSVHLGEDEDGEPVTSCVVEMVEPPAIVTKNGKRLSAGQTIVLAALQRAITDAGKEAPAGIPIDILKSGLVSRVASVSAWRHQARSTMAGPDTKPDSVDRQFRRHQEALQSFGVVQVWEGFAWPTPQ